MARWAAAPLLMLAIAGTTGAQRGRDGKAQSAKGHFNSMSGSFGSEYVSERPVSKVVDLLKEIQVQLGAEQEEDQETYDKFACWCETNDKGKSKAIADGEQKIKNLNAEIESLTAKSGQLTTDVSNLEETIAKGQKALGEATAVRTKELAEFNQSDKDAIVAIKGLHGAVETLGKHNAGAAMTQEAMMQVQQVLSQHMGHRQLAHLGLAAKQRHVVAAFLQQPAGYSSYNSNSGEIFGVLASMKESFETNMANARTEEKQGAAEFAQLKKAKTEELAAATKQSDSKQNELAHADESNANAKIDLKDTTAQLEADRNFLADLKSRCATMDSEWAARQKMRQDETTAVSEAVKMLTEDDARDLMSKTTGASLLQASMRKSTKGRDAAYRVIRDAALKSEGSEKPKLMMLAASMKSDVFDKMKDNVDKMIAKLTQDGKDEIKHRDYCIEELHQIGLQTDDTYHTKSNLDTKHADLESEIKRLTDEMEAAKASNADMQIQMKKAGETRKEESHTFTSIIAEQRATVEILTKAVAHLQAFYNRKAALLQVSAGKGGQAPPSAFQPYVKAGGGGVVAMISAIIQDSQHCIKMSYAENQQSQLAYEEFMRDLNKDVHAARKQITDQTQEKAEADGDMARTKEDLLQNLKDLEAADSKSQATHIQCDFVLKNFELRQKNLSNEIDSLYEAKAMMSQA